MSFSEEHNAHVDAQSYPPLSLYDDAVDDAEDDVELNELFVEDAPEFSLRLHEVFTLD